MKDTEIKEPEKICLFQKFKPIRDSPFLGKIVGYKTGCKLTAVKSAYVQIFFWHLRDTQMMKCEPEQCSIFNLTQVTSEIRSKEGPE